MTNHEEAGGQVLQNLGDILTQLAQRIAANRNGLICRLLFHDIFPPQAARC
jgi:hypothetical protein